MKRILVGVDGSAEGKAAAEFAAQQVEKGGQLVIAHIVHPPAVAEPIAMAPAAQAMREYGEALVRELAARCARPGLAIETTVRLGAPAAALAALGTELSVDLIVVGHRGLGAVQRLLLGSVAERLVRIANRPVLVHR